MFLWVFSAPRGWRRIALETLCLVFLFLRKVMEILYYIWAITIRKTTTNLQACKKIPLLISHLSSLSHKPSGKNFNFTWIIKTLTKQKTKKLIKPKLQVMTSIQLQQRDSNKIQLGAWNCSSSSYSKNQQQLGQPTPCTLEFRPTWNPRCPRWPKLLHCTGCRTRKWRSQRLSQAGLWWRKNRPLGLLIGSWIVLEICSLQVQNLQRTDGMTMLQPRVLWCMGSVKLPVIGQWSLNVIQSQVPKSAQETIY